VSVVFWLPLKDPVNVTCATDAIGVVEMGNATEVAPAATVTVVGTVAAALLLLERVTTAPPTGAAPLRVTVPVDPDPPVTLVGFDVKDEMLIACGFIVRTEFCEPLNVAVIVVWVGELTANVVTGKVADVAPAGTVKFAGTVASEVLLLVSVTTAPPIGAPAFSVTVPVDPTPPVTLLGFNKTEEVTGGFTVSEVFWLPL
jgi:hypothetical protein